MRQRRRAGLMLAVAAARARRQRCRGGRCRHTPVGARSASFTANCTRCRRPPCSRRRKPGLLRAPRQDRAFHAGPDPRRAGAMRALRHGAARPRRDARPDVCRRHPAAAAAMQHGRGGGRMGPRRRRARRGRRLARRLPPITELDSYECRGRNNIVGAKLSEHGKGNALDIGAIKLRNGAHLHADRSAGVEAVSRADAHARLRALHHRAGAGLGRLPRGAHPSRSRRALARLSDLPVECHRSGGDRRGGAVAAAAADQSHVRPDPVARARDAHKKTAPNLDPAPLPLPREVVSCWRRWRRSAPCAD